MNPAIDLFPRPIAYEKSALYAIILTIDMSHCLSIPTPVTNRYVKMSIDTYVLYRLTKRYVT